MNGYPSYFLSSADQLIALVAVTAILFGLSVIGAAICGNRRLAEIDHLVGWAVVASVFTVVGVVAAVPFTALAAGAAGIAVVALGVVWRRDGRQLPVAAGWGRIAVLGLPLLVMVSAMRGSQWDDFGHWLLIPRYLLDTDAFPSSANPYTDAGLAAYPYAWHFITYLAGRVAGQLVESAGPLFNIALIFGFGLLVVRLIRRGAGLDETASIGWGWAAVAIACVTFLNPTFVQKIVLTAYAETSTATATASAVVLAWLTLEATIKGDTAEVRRMCWSLGAVLALLVNLKQATFVLVAMVVIALIVVALRDRAVPFGRVLGHLPVIVGPAAIVYLAWRYHVITELSGREMVVRPFADWNIALLPQILANMVIVLAKKGYYFALSIVLTMFGLRGLWRVATPLDRFAALAAFVFLGYNAFLLFAYVATFGSFDALRVASYWRYNMHLGLVVVAFAAFGSGILWRRYGAKRIAPQRWATIAMVLVVLLPFVFARSLRFDTLPGVVFFRAIGAELGTMVLPDDGVFVADPTGSGESGVITSFELHGRGAIKGRISAFDSDRLAPLRVAIANPKVTLILAHSTNPGYSEMLGVDLAEGRSHLLRREGTGWRVVKSWPWPDRG
jgi:hypothetical protein